MTPYEKKAKKRTFLFSRDYETTTTDSKKKTKSNIKNEICDSINMQTSQMNFYRNDCIYS